MTASVMDHPLYILAVLAMLISLSEWLAATTWLRHFGSALLVIGATAVAANLGLIPTYSDEIAVYRGVFGYVAPLAIFWLILRVDLRKIWQAGLPMIGLFSIGASGTVAGVLVGMWVVGGEAAFGAVHSALGGMFVGTYIGGSINYNAIALHYDVVKQGTLYAGAAAVDSAMTAVWMVVTVAIPRWLGAVGTPGKETPNRRAEDVDRERVSPRELAVLVALGAASVWVSDEVAAVIGVPSILVLTTIALILAQFAPIREIRGARVIGWLAVMLFLAVIGALCDLHALLQIGQLGVDLLVFVAVILLVHGGFVFGLGALLKIDPALSAVASQANIGGSTSALALAKSLHREDLAVPAILVGAVGNALGTYLGFLMVAWLA